VVEIATAFDPDGVDIYFLNREPIFNVCSPEELIPIFAKPPAGILHLYVLYKKP